MSDARHTPASGFDWESAEDEDLTSLPGPDHGRFLWRVAEEERAAAFRFRREVLRGRAELTRAELAGRGISGPSCEKFARVFLLGGEGGAG